MKVAWFKKKHTTFKKTLWFFVVLGTQIKQKPIEKLEKTKCATKVDENMVPGITFWAKDWFLVHFWIPTGSQNWDFLASSAFNFSKEFYEFFKGGLDRCSEAPGASQGPSRDPPGDPQGHPQAPFWIVFQLKFQVIYSLLCFIRVSFFLACSVDVLEIPLIRGDRETLNR